jgi:hypothetical protein
MSQFPTDPKKIRARITRYERELRKEYETHRFIDDSSGKRYLLGPFYLLLGDLAGAVKSFTWFERMFPDDSGEPAHTLCWAIALYCAGQLDKASPKLLQAMLSNLYLIPHLLGREQPRLPIWHSSNMDEQDYLQFIEPEIWALWDAAAVRWAETLYDSVEFVRVRTRYIEIYEQLQTEPVGACRSQLVAEASALRYKAPGQI